MANFLEDPQKEEWLKKLEALRDTPIPQRVVSAQPVPAQQVELPPEESLDKPSQEPPIEETVKSRPTDQDYEPSFISKLGTVLAPGTASSDASWRRGVIAERKQKAVDAEESDPESMKSKLARFGAQSRIMRALKAAQENGDSEAVSTFQQMLEQTKGRSKRELDSLNQGAPKSEDTSPLGSTREYVQGDREDRKLDLAEEALETKADSQSSLDEYRKGMLGAKNAHEANLAANAISGNKIVQGHERTLSATGRGLNALNDPESVYTKQLHRDINLAFARAISGTGAVVPVGREEAIQMKSLQEYLGSKVQYLMGKPINVIPVGIRIQLQKQLEGLRYYTQQEIKRKVFELGEGRRWVYPEQKEEIYKRYHIDASNPEIYKMVGDPVAQKPKQKYEEGKVYTKKDGSKWKFNGKGFDKVQ